MVYSLYAIYDKVSGQYGSPTPHVNEASARRWFLHCVNVNEMAEPTDFQLFYLGVFDTSSGKLLSSLDDDSVFCCYPTFVCNGEVINNG